jgi:hypothetical protein
MPLRPVGFPTVDPLPSAAPSAPPTAPQASPAAPAPVASHDRLIGHAAHGRDLQAALNRRFDQTVQRENLDIGGLTERSGVPVALAPEATQADALRQAYESYARVAGLSDGARAEFVAQMMKTGGERIWHPGKNQTFSDAEFAEVRRRGTITMAPTAEQIRVLKEMKAEDDATIRMAAEPANAEQNQEGVGSFFEGVVAGDFSENDSWSATAGKIVGGLNPLADVRDIAAGMKHVSEGKDGAWVDLGTATLGAIPLIGDAGKAVIRGGRKVAKEAVEEGAEALAKEAAEKTARELATKQKALQLEAMDGGHSVARHGPEVSDADLQKRLTTGVAPDGVFSPTKASTRFNSYEDWMQTRDAAWKSIETKYGVDLSKPPAPGASQKYEIVVEYNRAIDDGFVADVTSKVKVADPANPKKVGNGYTGYSPVDGITRTRTKVGWDSQTQQWKTIQHFPHADGWDNATKTYAPTAEVDLGVKLP